MENDPFSLLERNAPHVVSAQVGSVAAPVTVADSPELAMHKAFYEAWEALHKIPRKQGRPSQEHQAAAQLLVDRAHELRALYGKTGKVNGTEVYS